MLNSNKVCFLSGSFGRLILAAVAFLGIAALPAFAQSGAKYPCASPPMPRATRQP